MGAPDGPVAYAVITLNIYADGSSNLQASGAVMEPDGSLQSMGGGWQFSVEVPLDYGATAASVQASIGQAIAAGYGGSAPDVVLLPSF
jgi:hypothetical protein